MMTLMWFLIVSVSLFLLWLIVCFCRYRISEKQASIEISSEVHYKFAELNVSHRHAFEGVMGKCVLRLNGIDTPFYISKGDRKKVWAESPIKMKQKGYSLIVSIKVPRLVMGGYGVAKVVSLQRVDKAPIISK